MPPYQGGYGPTPQRMPNPQMNNGMSANMGNPMANSMNSMGSHMNSNMMPNSSMSPMSMNGPMGMNSNVMNKTMPGVGGAVQPPHAPMYGSSSPGMTHRNRVAPYPTPQQHMAQKRPTQYNPMVQQYGPGMQHYGGATQHGFNAAQVIRNFHLTFSLIEIYMFSIYNCYLKK